MNEMTQQLKRVQAAPVPAAGTSAAGQPAAPAAGTRTPAAAGGTSAEAKPAAPAAGTHDARGRGDTRARIQQVAVALFTEQGYEKTSLREIAERLDVTKAALYYHFKSKEDIIRSLVEDFFGQVDALVAWARAQPPGAGTRAEILRRYVGIVAEGDEVFRMLHQNQAAVNTFAAEKSRGELFRERMGALVEMLTGPTASISEQLRAAMAIGGVSVGWMFFADQVPDRAEFCAAVLAIATDIAEGGPVQAG
jgi:AcrR family transcriptional regulator